MTDWILDSIVGLLQSQRWRCQVAGFIDHNCIVFDNEEQSQFSYTEIHRNYQNMVEQLLEEFMGELGISAEQFLSVSTDITTNSSLSVHKALFEQVQAAEDYQLFKSMMSERNLELNKLALRQFNQQPQMLHSTKKESPSSSTTLEQQQGEEDKELEEIMRRSKIEYDIQQSEKEQNLKKALAQEEEDVKRAILQEKQDLQRTLAMTEDLKLHKSTNSNKTPQAEARVATTKRKASPQSSPPTISSAPVKDRVTMSKGTGVPSLPRTAAKSQRPAVSGAEAAASWLASARSEVSATSSTGSTQHQQTLEDMRQREKHLKKQRDLLLVSSLQQKKKGDKVAVIKTVEQTSSLDSSLSSSSGANSKKPVLCSALASKLKQNH